MNPETLVYVLVGILVVAAFAAFWVGDRRRNRDVKSDRERLDADPDSGRRSR